MAVIPAFVLPEIMENQGNTMKNIIFYFDDLPLAHLKQIAVIKTSHQNCVKQAI